MSMFPSPRGSDKDLPSNPPALSDDVAMEMAAAFGWDAPATDDQADADYAAQRCDEEELLALYPGLRGQCDADLIDLIANPPRLMSDADEVSAVAAIILARRLGGVEPCVPSC